MKKTLLFCAALALGFIGMSCSNDDTEPILPPEITVGTCDVVPAEGGSASISYEITNPISETTVPEAKSDQDWVHSFQASADAISFTVDANESEPGSAPRTATLTITYPDAQPVKATVTQAAPEPEPVEELTFTIEIVSETSSEIVATITPSLEDATYVAGLVYASDYTTDEELIASDIESFQEPDYSGNPGQIADHLETGILEKETFGAYKTGDVYIYAYGLTAEGEATSKVFKESAKVLDRPIITTNPDYTASYAPLEVPVEGGQYEVEFTVENPTEDGEVTYELQWGVEWVHDIVLSDGKISFTVDSNEAADPDGEPRTTFISLDYPNVASRPAINIRQAVPEKTEELKIEIEVVSLSTDGSYFNFIPSDKTATYYVDYTFGSNYTSDEELLSSSLEYLTESDLITGDLMDKYIYSYMTGDLYVYAFGVTADKTVTSPLYKVKVNIPAPPTITISPEYSYSSPLEVPVEGGTFEINYTVDNPVEGGEVTCVPAFGVEWIHDFVVSDGKITFTVDSNASAEPGSDPRRTFFNLEYPGTSSRPAVNILQAAPAEGQTEELTIDIQTISVSTDGSYFKFTPSNNTSTYVIGYINASEYTTDEALLASKAASISEWDLITGELSSKYLYTWEAGDIYVYAFGVTADKTVTSPLYKIKVTIPGPPTITTDPKYNYANPMRIPVEGGTFEVSYTVENPIEGSQVTCIPPFGVTWVHDFVVSDGKVSFTVDSNEAAEPGSNPRMANINLDYDGASERATIVISQAAPTE